MNRRMFLSFALLTCALFARPVVAEEKKALDGSWQLSGGETRVDFDKDTMKVSPHNKDEVILIVFSYTVGKDGVVKAKLSEIQGTAKDKAKGLIPEGLELTFKWKASGDSATIEDVKGENADGLKGRLEGKYEKK
jgi:hypothetical protein